MRVVNFKANYISPVFVQKKQGSSYADKEVSFVEFQKNSQADTATLEEIKNSWKTAYIKSLYTNFTKYSGRKKHLYGVVDQELDIEKRYDIKINPDKVLGLISVNAFPRKKLCELLYFQVKPDYIYKSDEQNAKCQREYKNVGSAIIKKLQSVYKDYLIEGIPSKKALPFYELHGFKNADDDTIYINWKA